MLDMMASQQTSNHVPSRCNKQQSAGLEAELLDRVGTPQFMQRLETYTAARGRHARHTTMYPRTVRSSSVAPPLCYQDTYLILLDR